MRELTDTMGDMEAYILKSLDLVRMEGFPVEHDCDILIQNLLGGYGQLSGSAVADFEGVRATRPPFCMFYQFLCVLHSRSSTIAHSLLKFLDPPQQECRKDFFKGDVGLKGIFEKGSFCTHLFPNTS